MSGLFFGEVGDDINVSAENGMVSDFVRRYSLMDPRDRESQMRTNVGRFGSSRSHVSFHVF